MFLLAACSGVADNDGYAPVPGGLYSEFQETDLGQSQYGPFLAATLAQHDADFFGSAEYYLQALDVDPDSRFVADRAFLQLLYAGRMDDAAEVAVDLSGTDDADDLVRLLNVLEAFKRQDWTEVRRRASERSMSGFGGIVAPVITAWSFAAENQGTAAETALSDMLDDGRLDTLATEHLAYMLDFMKDFENAEQKYKQLVTSEQPTSLQPFVAYSYMLMKSGRRDQAYDFLGQQAKRFNNNGYLLKEGSRIASGIAPSQVMASPRGAVGGMFFRLASEFSQGRTPQAAIVYLRLASYLMPEVPDIYFMLGNVLDQMENPRAAASVYASIPSVGGLGRVAESRRISALQRAGDDVAAEAALRNALRETPGEADFLIALGDIVRGRGDFDEAILHYSNAIKQGSSRQNGDWYVYFARGVSYEQVGDWSSAEFDLRKALQINPDEASVLNYLGYSWIDRGVHTEDAKQMIEKAVELSPDDGFIMDSYGWVHYLTGDYEKAVELLEKAVRMEPNDVTINTHLGDAYWKVGRRIEARFQWQHALDGTPTDTELAALTAKMQNGLPAGA